jgi:hypothetical protein
MDNPKSQSVYTISRAILLLLSIWGAAIAVRTRSLRIFPTMLFVVPVIYYTLTLTGARLALPYEPLQIGAGAIAVAALARRIMPARDPKLSRSSTIVREPLLALDEQDVQPHHA